ncbi:hypothetical protein N7507_011027 [Penicillium longicatenatum]|nr:hypothetical protein N7507_011027 [Penicillium longicatenatum]
MGAISILTAGLIKTNSHNELLPGEAFVVRFKNPCRNYRTDIWLAIILSEELGPGKHLSGRMKGAKGADGTWDTTPNERVYPLYMPGRNSYRWSHVSHLFKLPGQVPPTFDRTSTRGDADLFRMLQKIALKAPGCTFWKSMAEKEMTIKGKRSRELSLILPGGYEDILLGVKDLPEFSGISRKPGYRSGSATTDAAFSMLPPKTQESTTSLSTAKNLDTASNGRATNGGDGLTYLSFPGENYAFGYTNSSSSFATSSRKFDGSGSSSSSALGDRQVNPFSQVPKELFLKVKDGAENGRTSADILQLSLEASVRSWVLGKPEAEEIHSFFNHIVQLPSQPEFTHIKSFFLTSEFKPRLVQVNTPVDSDNTQEEKPALEVGDVSGIGRHWQLQDIRTSDDLCEVILSLGNLYTFARRLNLNELIRMIAFKLQVAWNSYPGLCQLEPLLDIILLVFTNNCSMKDHLQEWILKFVSDVQDLLLLACSVKYQIVMRELPSLYNAVSDLRMQLVSKSPQKYTDQRRLLESRGIDQL